MRSCANASPFIGGRRFSAGYRTPKSISLVCTRLPRGEVVSRNIIMEKIGESGWGCAFYQFGTVKKGRMCRRVGGGSDGWFLPVPVCSGGERVNKRNVGKMVGLPSVVTLSGKKKKQVKHLVCVCVVCTCTLQKRKRKCNKSKAITEKRYHIKKLVTRSGVTSACLNAQTIEVTGDSFRPHSFLP